MVSIELIKEQLIMAIEEIKVAKSSSYINDILESLTIYATEAEHASVWMYDSSVLKRERTSGVKKVSLESNESLLYKCFITKQASIDNYLASTKGYKPEIDNPDNIQMKSKIMLPLISNDKLIGILTAYSSIKKFKKFTKYDLENLKVLVPFIIDSIFKIRIMNGEAEDRRVALKNESSYTRRKTDMIKDINTLEKQRENGRNHEETLEYLSNIVHDIRTPASGLIGFLDILEEEIKDERLKEYVGYAKNSASLINTLTTSILNSVASEQNIDIGKVTQVNTVKFFTDISEVFSANLYKKRIDYTICIDPNIPKDILIDSMKLKRVIINLIGNAIKFTPENRTIAFSIRYKIKSKKLNIFVKDTGIGIAQDRQEAIFKSFEQAEETTKDEFGGTGLGLSISASYVKELGGKLLLDSVLNEGSTFYFDMPIEFKDETLRFELIEKSNANIVILLDNKNKFVAKHIAQCLVKLGVSQNSIQATTSIEKVPSSTTHLIVFESKLEKSIFAKVKHDNLEFMVIEENFLSLKSEDISHAKLASQYSYMGDYLYSFALMKRMPKVLIVEDDEISSILLKTMIKDEYCSVDIARNGQDGLDMLSKALKENEPYNIVYADQNMPILTGSEMLNSYDKYKEELSNKPTSLVCISEKVDSFDKKDLYSHPLVTVSISGNEKDRSLYDFDYQTTKPFNRKEIIAILTNL